MNDIDEPVTLREVSEADRDFLIQVYASTREAEMALVDWTPAQRAAFLTMQFDAQQAHYRQYFPDSTYQVILVGGRPAGRVWVGRLEDEIRILDITLLPPFRNRGVGTPIIRDVMRQAEEARKPLGIYVESFNPSMRLFERLGFLPAGEHGSSFKMQWTPKGPVRIETEAEAP